MRRALSLVLPLVLIACASAPPKEAPPPPPKEETPAPPPVEAEPEAPKTWDDVPKFYGHKCPGPFFELPTPTTVTVGARTFTITGSTMKLDGGPWKGPLKFGVLGAVKDPEPKTRENIKRAMKEFKRSGVHFVIVNGDLIGNEAGDLAKVVRMLGEEISLPIFAHSGNYEWSSAFTDTFVEVGKVHPQLFNMNLIRHIDLGGVHLFSMPGWSVRHFVKPAACFYGEDDVALLRTAMKKVVEDGDVVVVTAHGPPRGRGKQSLDFTYNDGNVGDESLKSAIKELPVKFGIFSHILESGGRATSDVERQPTIKLPMRTPARSLYINAGSTSSGAVKMLNNSFSEGMAAVFVLDDIKGGGKARVTFLKLRK